MKNLQYYVIPETFKQNKDWHDLYINDIYYDFNKFMKQKKLDVELGDESHWVEEPGTIDLELNHEGVFNECIGNFYITWDDNGTFRNISYGGYTLAEDEYKHWEWK